MHPTPLLPSVSCSSGVTRLAALLSVVCAATWPIAQAAEPAPTQTTAAKAVAAKPASAKPASAKPASAKPASAKPASAKPASAKPQAKANKLPPATPVAAPVVAQEEASDEHKLAVARQVHTGRIACELGAHVQVTPDATRVGGFVVQLASHTFHMSPVLSSTGAVRLEDTKNGAMWLQLGNKSMLMNTKLGQRMADECQSPAQHAVAESLKNNPPPSLLEDPSVARK